MSIELQTYRIYVGFVKGFLLVGGLCPNMKEQYTVYRLLSMWTILCCIIVFCNIGNFCIGHATNINVLTASLALFATLFNVIVKACCFTIHRRKLLQVNNILDSLLEKALQEERGRSAAFFFLRIFYRLIYAQTFLMFLTSLLYLVKPVIVVVSNSSKNVTSVQYPLPVPATYPWAIDSLFLWQLHYFFELHVYWCIFSISTGVDAFYGFCMFRISALLRLLAFKFSGRFTVNKVEKEEEETRQKIFGEYVDTHVTLLRCRDVMQRVYGPVILFVTVVNAVCMCTLIFQTSQVSRIGVSKAVPMAIYLTTKLIQTFVYAWPGDLLVSESELLRREVYFSGWYLLANGTSLAKHFLLVLTQRPMVLKVYNLLQVSLDLFAKVLNTTISYYFLLKTLEGDKTL